MFCVPNEFNEPFTRLMITQVHIATFLLDAGIYIVFDDEGNPTACTDGARWIRLNRAFMKACLDGAKGAKGADIFVLAHEIMHCMLMHDKWMKHVREHGFLVSTKLELEIRKFNPYTKWRAGMVIPCRFTLMQHAMDYVINAVLDTWGLKIKPYSVLFDNRIALYTDSEETAYCRLIGREQIEPGDKSEDEGEQGGSQPGAGSPGAGAGDMVEAFEGDLPAGADDGGLDDIRRKMAVAKAVEACEAGSGMGAGGLGAGRLLDRLLPSPIRWRQQVRVEVKAASGRGQATWNRVSKRGLALGTVLPGHIGRQAGVVVIQDDVSGSQGQLELEQMGGCIMEVMKQVQPKRLILLDTDYVVQQVREPKSAQELYHMLTREGFKGGGGTNMAAGFEWCKENRIVPDTVITLTDGYTPWPDDYEPARSALWVITTPGIVAPEAAGRSVFMPLDRNC